MHAYDLALVADAPERTSLDCHGWCFGLPPGITTVQWPLDPANGYPLQHGFTLLLPSDYRCHGPEIVAVSFFASAVDLNDGGPIEEAPEIRTAMAGEAAPDDPDLLPFWRAERAAHPRLHRLEDILGTAYAAVLLTRSEFEGPICSPPRLNGNPYLDRLPPPAWMAVGSGAAFWQSAYSPALKLPMEQYGFYRMLGGEPGKDLSWSRALRWTPRACDPNAGRTPCDPHGHAPTDYVQPFFFTNNDDKNTFHDQPWIKDHAPNHIGGTMRPVQSVPQFSPCYVEFEEYLGGYNFGGGNAQLDFADMKFDWACG